MLYCMYRWRVCYAIHYPATVLITVRWTPRKRAGEGIALKYEDWSECALWCFVTSRRQSYVINLVHFCGDILTVSTFLFPYTPKRHLLHADGWHRIYSCDCIVSSSPDFQGHGSYRYQHDPCRGSSGTRMIAVRIVPCVCVFSGCTVFMTSSRIKILFITIETWYFFLKSMLTWSMSSLLTELK